MSMTYKQREDYAKAAAMSKHINNNKHISNLVDLYNDWLFNNDISSPYSAEELLFEGTINKTLTEQQKEFLQSFINIWSTIDNKDYEVNNE